MDVVSDIAPIPGIAAGEPVAGGVAAGGWLSASSDPALLYRYTSQLLEVQNMAAIALGIPEALATLYSAQLQSSAADDLVIAAVKPVPQNGITYLLVYARDRVLRTGRLYAFNPYTLAVYPIAGEAPYNVSSLSVSSPVVAGSGSSTEWEFSIVCFGLPGGKSVLGNLAISVEGAQLTALTKHIADKNKGNVASSFALVMPGSSGRAFVFFGLESGKVAVLEYSPFGAHHIRSTGVVSEIPQLGAAVCLSALSLSDDSCILCVGYNTATCRGSLATVAAHVVTAGGDNRSRESMNIAFKGLAHVEGSMCNGGSSDDDQPEGPGALLTSAKIVDLAIYDANSDAYSADAARSLVVVALANACADNAPPSQTGGSSAYQGCGLLGAGHARVYGLLSSWILDEQASAPRRTTSQCSSVPGAVFGMHLSTRSTLVEVASDKYVLAGNVLAGPANSASFICQNGTSAPLDISAYISSSGDFAYATSTRAAITEQRRRMDGELFIDLLLRMAGIASTESHSAYPPRTPAALHSLIKRIGSCELDDLKQHCLAYYMILDQSAGALVTDHGLYSVSNTDPPELNMDAAKYAHDRLIPRHFEYLIRGYWLMDHGQTAASILYFADPSVIADWAPKILGTAVASGFYREAAMLLNSATALMQPRLEEQISEAPVVMEVLLHCNFTSAFTFQRQKLATPDLRRALLGQMYAFALSTHSRRGVADQLATLPFDGVEEAALEEYCVKSDAPVYTKDFLALHYVNCGRYAEAIRMFKAIANAEEGQHLTDAQKRKREERLAMVQNLTLLLPVAQRWLVEELEPTSDGADSIQPILPSQAVEKATEEYDAHDMAKSHPMDIDAISLIGFADDRDSAQRGSRPPALAKTQLNAPLSASKSSRQLRSVVGTQGSLQNSSHSLLRVLVKQMSAASPAVTQQHVASFGVDSSKGAHFVSALQPMTRSEWASAANQKVIEETPQVLPANKPATPEVSTQFSVSAGLSQRTPTVLPSSITPLDKPSVSAVGDISEAGVESSSASTQHTPIGRALRPASSGSARVPFSGPPSTPRLAKALGSSQGTPSKPDSSLINAGQTPGRNVFAAAPGSETPQISKRVPGGFPSLAGKSSSPFEQTKLISRAKPHESPALKDSKQAGMPKPKPLLKDRKGLEDDADASTQRYNLRHRAGPAPVDDGQAVEGQGAAAEFENTVHALDSTQSRLRKARPSTKRSKQAPARHAGEATTSTGLADQALSGLRGARGHERLARQPATATPKQSSRIRKRE